MKNTLTGLAERLEKKAKEINNAASEASVKAALSIVGELAYRTPVDTSNALSGWQVSLINPTLGRIGPHFPGLNGSTYRQSASETITIAKQVLKNKKPGEIIYITNNEPYIRRLNDGYSGQAPAGFVERAVLIGRKSLASFKIKD